MPEPVRARPRSPVATTTSGNLAYFLLLAALSVPFWALDALPLQRLREFIPFNLPVSALAAFAPLLAASILTFQRRGLTGTRELLKRAFDYRSAHRAWYVVALAVMPIILVLAYALMRVTGRPLPDPQIPLLKAPLFFALFFLFAIGEEVGWQGYAFEPMQQRYGVSRAALLLGIVWAIWHSVTFFQTGHPLPWIIWQSLSTVALRVLIVWVYVNAGDSLLAAILLHAMTNEAEFLFPNNGSHYDPFVTSLIMWALVGVILWRGISARKSNRG